AGVSLAELDRDLLDTGVLHERDGAFVVQAQEAVPGVRHAVHPVERDELHAEHVGEELDLRFHVGGADREVMQSVDVVHLFLQWLALGYALDRVAGRSFSLAHAPQHLSGLRSRWQSRRLVATRVHRVSALESFRLETREWLAENCPSAARGAGQIPWGSSKV